MHWLLQGLADAAAGLPNTYEVASFENVTSAPPLTTYGAKLIKRGKDCGESVRAF
jgi:hypothetical protein